MIQAAAKSEAEAIKEAQEALKVMGKTGADGWTITTTRVVGSYFWTLAHRTDHRLINSLPRTQFTTVYHYSVDGKRKYSCSIGAADGADVDAMQWSDREVFDTPMLAIEHTIGLMEKFRDDILLRIDMARRHTY